MRHAANNWRDTDWRRAGRLLVARWLGTNRRPALRPRNWGELFAVDLIITYHNPYNPL